MIASSILLALAIVAPQDGATVPTLKEGQKGYFRCGRAERFIRMDNPADRRKMFMMGATQKPLKLEWTGETNAVYELSISTEAGPEESYDITNRTDVYVTNLEIGAKYRWMIRCVGTGESVSSTFSTESDAPRFLRAGGVGNFRDVGGWSTVDGRRVRQNMILRSAGLRSSSKSRGGFFKKKIELGARRVTDAGLETLKGDFHIKTDLELRTPQETAGMMDTLLGTNAVWRNVSFAAYDFIDNAIRGREPFAKIFRIFLHKENYPVLMHCSGGRDRTGTLVFLLNGLLGVSEDDLCRDWEASIFSDQGAGFTSDRIRRLLDYLNSLPGNTFQERIESYMKSCGITDEEMSRYKSLMLE